MIYIQLLTSLIRLWTLLASFLLNEIVEYTGLASIIYLTELNIPLFQKYAVKATISGLH